MKNKSSNISNNQNYIKPMEVTKENIICKDGFCSIPNHKEISKTNKEDINIFDPI